MNNINVSPVLSALLSFLVTSFRSKARPAGVAKKVPSPFMSQFGGGPGGGSVIFSSGFMANAFAALEESSKRPFLSSQL
jgi:hypothetical protein